MVFVKICEKSLFKLNKYILSINPYVDTYSDRNDYIQDYSIMHSPYDFENLEEYLYTYVDIDGELVPVYSYNNNINNDDIYGELYIKGLNGEEYIIYSELVLGSNGKYYSIYPNYIYTSGGAIVEVRGSAKENLENILKLSKNYQKVLR